MAALETPKAIKDTAAISWARLFNKVRILSSLESSWPISETAELELSPERLALNILKMLALSTQQKGVGVRVIATTSNFLKEDS